MIDIPKDVQQTKFQPVFPAAVEFRNPLLSLTHRASDEVLQKVLALVAGAKRPVIYAGGGIISADAHRELRSLRGDDQHPGGDDPHGRSAASRRQARSRCSGSACTAPPTATGPSTSPTSCLCSAPGSTTGSRATRDKFAAQATIVHVDIDASEHNKNKRVGLPIVSDVKYALGRLNELIAAAKFTPPDTAPWHAQIAKWKKEHPFSFEHSKHIQPQEAVKALYELTKGDAIIVTGVGQHQMWAAQFYRFDEPRRYISSLGLGAMGFGYPAALGAKVACPDKQVIDIDGDGSFAMNIQELATAHIEKIAAKAMILNNQHLGMVVQWEDRFYGSVRGNTILGDENNVGSPDNPDALYPDFVKIAEGFGVRGRRVIKKSELREAIQEMLDYDGPFVLDVVVPYTEHVLPMIPAGRSVKEMLLK